jgi:thioesterase domain-containing protein
MGAGPWPGAAPGWGGWTHQAPPEKGPLVKIKPEGRKPPFFCIHAILGSVFPYHRLSLHLDGDRPLYGIQARGLFPGEEPRETIEEMADAYVEQLRRARPTGPYHLGGYSFGGWVAWEMARRLGDEVGVLAVFGVPIPVTAVWPALATQADYVLRYARDWQRLVRNSAMAEGYPDWESRLPPSQRVVWANGWAQARWVPKTWDRCLDLFLTTEQAVVYAQEPTMGWQRVCTGEIRAHRIEGNHLNLFEAPQVEDLARVLVARMQQTEGSA